MPATPDQLPPLESWPAIIVAIIGGLAALLVPFNGFMKTWFEYRIEAKKAEALKTEPAREVAAAAGGALFGSIETADLTAAIKELTATLRAGIASEQAQHADKIGAVMGRLTEAMDRWDERESQNPRHNRRGHHDR